MAGVDTRGGMKGSEVAGMKDARTTSPFSSARDHPLLPLSLLQLEDSLGTKDPAAEMILIEYDYLPSSSSSALPSREPSALSSSRRIVLAGIFSRAGRRKGERY